MIFLIEYDRTTGVVIDMKSFSDDCRKAAEDARLGLELELNRSSLVREVVLLEARSEEALRRTHRRYFENLAQLTRSSATSTG